MSIVDEFLESGDSGWALDSPQVTQFVFTELDKHDDVILVAKNASEFFLLNRQFLRVKVITPSENGAMNERERTMGR